MELLLTFQNTQRTLIPIDYQYYLSSWIYNILSKGDEKYATFLHDQGYKAASRGKIFKLFSFSRLFFEYDQNRDRTALIVKSPELTMKARFKVDAAIEGFIKGLFQDQILRLKNGYNSMASFEVKTVETRGIKIDTDHATIRATSPIVISLKTADGKEEYLSPTHSEYEQLFLTNLFDKYLASGDNIKPEWQSISTSFKLLYPDRIKSKLVTIKSESKQETRVRGWLFDFEIVAPREVIEIGLLGGFGKECGMGFGFGELIA